MDNVMFWIALVGAVAAIAAAVAAGVQAKAAAGSRRDADVARDDARVARDESAQLAAEANAAFRRQAEAQEEANRIKREELAPPDWTGPVHVNGQKYRVTNSSGGFLYVSDVEIAPGGTEKLVRVYTKADGAYDHGDSVQYIVARVMGTNPEKLTIVYRRDGDDEDRRAVVSL